MVDEENYSASLPEITPEEKIYNQELNNCIIDWMKEITIHQEKSDPVSYLEAVVIRKQNITKKDNKESITNVSDRKTL